MKTGTKRMLGLMFSVSLIVILTTQAMAASNLSNSLPNAFLGKWEAVDLDGSLMNLAIAGNQAGPFQITWTDKYISFCNGEAGIVRGVGWINENDTDLLDADLQLECFTSQTSLDLDLSFRYHRSTDTLSVLYSFGQVTIWQRPGKPQAPPPVLNLRVNYGHDWVESFYEAGHMVWVLLTGSDGQAVKATNQATTAPRSDWGGEPGFQTSEFPWYDASGNLMQNPPDIQPGDWVFAWVDNGATAQVQIGDISGNINYEENYIEGSITAPWFTDQVQVQCLDWTHNPPFDNDEYGFVTPDGSSPYSCAWDGWVIQPGDTIGVGYFGPDGNWVANAFTAPRIIAFPAADQIFAYNWPTGSQVSLAIDGSSINQTATVEPVPWDPNDIRATFSLGELYDLKPGDRVTLSGSGMELTYVVENLAITAVDIEANTIAGTADNGAQVYAWVHGYGENEMLLTATEGAWLADFNSIDLDLIDDMCGRVEIRNAGSSTAVDWCARKLNLRVNYGNDWVESFYEAGHTLWVTLTENDGQTLKATNQATTASRPDWGGEPGFQTTESPWLDAAGNLMQNPPDIQPGDWVFGRVDNGVSAKVQIGEIRGQVSSDQDSITGTILASWLTGPVQVECLDWSSIHMPPATNQDGGFILPNGTEPYTCSWDPAEWDVQPWQDIGVGYFTPDGHWVANAFRDERWMAFWTGDLDPGSWSEGEHSYTFHMSYAIPEPGGDWTSPSRTLSVSTSALQYSGKVLLQVAGAAPQIAWTGNACEVVPAIHPDQATRFVWGWVNDYSMTYEQALAHFSGMTVDTIWDGDTGGSTPLTMGELLPWNPNEPLWDYRCSLTEHN